MRIDRKELELLLEETPDYRCPREYLEQYITPSTIASRLLWEAFIRGDIGGRVVLDLGCGTLRLGIGALYLGAERVVGVDIDCGVLDQVYQWLKGKRLGYRVLLVCSDASIFSARGIDTVVMNPPFGVKRWNRGLDMIFLSRALSIAGTVYTIHKYSPGERRLVREIAKAFNSRIVYEDTVEFPIKMTYRHHRRRIHRVLVDLYGIRRRKGYE